MRRRGAREAQKSNTSPSGEHLTLRGNGRFTLNLTFYVPRASSTVTRPPTPSSYQLQDDGESNLSSTRLVFKR